MCLPPEIRRQGTKSATQVGLCCQGRTSSSEVKNNPTITVLSAFNRQKVIMNQVNALPIRYSLAIIINFYREKYHLGGRVATRKRHSIQRKKSKRRLVTEVGQLTYKSSKVQGDITKLTIPPKPQKMEVVKV